MEVPAGARATTNRNHICLSTATGNMNGISLRSTRRCWPTNLLCYWSLVSLS